MTSKTQSSWHLVGFDSLLVLGLALWVTNVVREVDGPYLDEYFHIRQAQVYFENRFSEWDDKITTPPGLYLLSYPWLHLFQFLHVPGSIETHLRLFNAVALLFLWRTTRKLTRSVQQQLRNKDAVAGSKDSTNSEIDSTSVNHVATNIALFPPLFFFSGLYYTDIVSALLVLKAHAAFYEKQPIWVFFWSMASLTLRQTNVFWTAIYLAALEVKRSLDVNRGKMQVPTKKDQTQKEVDDVQSFMSVFQLSWRTGEVYDRRFELAALEDYLKTALSLAVAALSKVTSVLIPLLPHVMVLAAFAVFVFLNGGVVLGDKSNHVASLHVPQMLYIWPYIVFFSFPMTLASLVSKYSRGTLMIPLPDTAIALLGAAIFWIAMNTVVHPFILADNRHYTFYVFRLLMRYPWVKYVISPVYLLCGWASLCAFGSRTSTTLIWLLVSTLSLVTAPLVEPRYFILPWIVWRLHVGAPKAGTKLSEGKHAANKATVVSQIIDLLDRHGLWLETAWLVVVNAVTGYIFLHWKFKWAQEPETVMRFMW